jgi:hypothetical protein
LSNPILTFLYCLQTHDIACPWNLQQIDKDGE